LEDYRPYYCVAPFDASHDHIPVTYPTLGISQTGTRNRKRPTSEDPGFPFSPSLSASASLPLFRFSIRQPGRWRHHVERARTRQGSQSGIPYIHASIPQGLPPTGEFLTCYQVRPDGCTNAVHLLALGRGSLGFFFWMTAHPPPTTVLIGTNLQLCTEFVTMWRVWPELSLLSRRERGGSSFPPIRFFRVVSVPRFTARLAIWSKVVRQRRRPNNNKAQSWESIWLAQITLFCCNSIRSSTECVGSGVHFGLLCFSKAWTGWVDRFSSSPSLLSSDGGTRDRSPLAPT
jgi:hypothetical protein